MTKSCSAGTLGKDGCDGNHGADGPTGKANNALSNSLRSLTEIKRSCIYLYMELLEHNRCSLLVRHYILEWLRTQAMMERRKNQRKIAFYHPEGNQLAKSFFFQL